MKVRSIKDAEQIERKYGTMKILAGGNSSEMRTENIDFKILEIFPYMSTSKHYHRKSETILHVISGCADLETDNNCCVKILTGDVVIVGTNQIHKIVNKQNKKCIIIEIMSPPYNKADIYYLGL